MLALIVSGPDIGRAMRRHGPCGLAVRGQRNQRIRGCSCWNGKEAARYECCANADADGRRRMTATVETVEESVHQSQ